MTKAEFIVKYAEKTGMSKKDAANAVNAFFEVTADALKAGDKVEIRENYKSYTRIKMMLDATNGRVTPEWLTGDNEKLEATVNALPTREQIDVPVDEMQIVELYSK